MGQNHERLLSRTRLLAELIRMLATSSKHTYHQLATEIGISRNVLYYFANSKRSGEDECTTVKVNVLASILRWFEAIGAKDPRFNDREKEIAGEIQKTFQHEDNDEFYSRVASAFRINSNGVTKMRETFSNYYIGVRQRGSSGLFQVSIHQFQESESSEFYQWRMLFLQGRDPTPEHLATSEQKFLKKHEQVGVEISGFATVEDKVVTCIGRREGSHSINMLNIMLPRDNSQKELLASFNSYSRSESISRRMFLYDSDVDSKENSLKLSGHLGDVSLEDIMERRTSIADHLMTQRFLGYSLTPTGLKIHEISEKELEKLSEQTDLLNSRQ